VEAGKRAVDAPFREQTAQISQRKADQRTSLGFTFEKKSDQEGASLQIIIKDLVAIGGMGNEWQPER
jgi:hypothetical protein